MSNLTEDPYVAVDEVAKRLGLPLGVLVRRVQAGDVPARRVDGPDGPRYELRIGDLGIETEPGLAPEQIRNHGRYVHEEGVAEVEISGSAVGSEPASVPAIQFQEIPAVADDVTAAVPPPRSDEVPELTLIDYPRTGPLADISAMSLDPRELVAGLLDRWERTLEQRIYAEQRQRFEAELASRQSMVKELQLEVKMERAQASAAQAEKDRLIADRERTLMDKEIQLSQLQAELRRQKTTKRGWFRR